MNSIEREIYVTRKALESPIAYTRATNAQSLRFKFCDFIIPEGTEALVYVQKPGGKAVYNTAAVEGNVVVVEVTTQMFSEQGRCILQIQLVKGEKILVTFSQPVDVFPNFTEGDAIQSENESGFFREYADKMNNAVESANNAVDEIERRLENGEFIGEQGPAGSIRIQKVITGEPGTQAKVENTGNNKDAVLIITIPKGEMGEIKNLVRSLNVTEYGFVIDGKVIADKFTELTSGLSATQIIKTGSKSIALSTTETWYRLGYINSGNMFYGEFLVASNWSYNEPNLCKFTVGGANTYGRAFNITKQFYSYNYMHIGNSNARIKKVRAIYRPSGVEGSIYVDVCLKGLNTTNGSKADKWSYELSMYRDQAGGFPDRWVNSNFEANPAIPSGYEVKELDLDDLNVSDFILYRTFTKDNFDIGANTYTTTSISYTVPSGYKMLCVVDVNIDNATSSGINKSSCNTYDTKWDGSTITVGIRNRATSAAKLKLEARVLFILDRNI